MKKILILLTVMLAVDPLYAEDFNNKELIAEVGDLKISREEFQNILIAYRKSDNMETILATYTLEGKEKILQMIVDQKLFAIEAKRRQLDQEPQVRKAIENAIEKTLSEYILKQEISKLDLSESGLRRYYEANKESYMTATKVKARHVVVGTLREAEIALREIFEGRDFSSVASVRNIDRSKAKRGDLGWVGRGVMVKAFEDALFSLKQGQISDIVKTSFGYHIIMAEQIDPGQIIPFETVKEDIQRQMTELHISNLKRELKESYPVKINRESLNDLKM